MNATLSADPIVRSAARWFWWIAGLSLVNTVLFHTGSSVNFVLGLGMTAVTNALYADNVAVSVALAAVGVAFYAFIGLRAAQERLWAFYLGLAVYALDALVYVKFEDWTPVAFHGVAAFFILKGVAQVRGRGEPAVVQPDA
jgi:hypothetical protein